MAATAHERRYERSATAAPKLERAEGGMQRIVGYAAVFYNPSNKGTEYELWDDLVERMAPGCFDRALKEDDVRGLFNHDASIMLGRTASGTMRLSVDSVGLRYEITPPDTQAARDVMKLIERGDVSGSSFMFTCDSSTYARDGNRHVVVRNSVRLFDVGPVAFPAYTATDTGIRSASADPATARLELEEWLASQPNASSGNAAPGAVANRAAAARARSRVVDTILRS